MASDPKPSAKPSWFPEAGSFLESAAYFLMLLGVVYLGFVLCRELYYALSGAG